MNVDVDALFLLRGSYITAALMVLIGFTIPALRSRFFDYGPRADVTGKHQERGQQSARSVLSVLLDNAAKMCVPHSWFASFYTVSVACSLFWASNLLMKGLAFETVAEHVPQLSRTMTFRQVMVAWAMMFVQGSRRLYECLVIARPSTSRMWFGHWLVGNAFYIGTNMAIWIEGAPTIREHPLSPHDFVIKASDLKSCFGIMIFILASGFQHDCHAYLASLKSDDKAASESKYRLPEHPAFNISVTPHYLAECLIYLSLALVSAPSGHWLNSTMFCALTFIVINLGVTAYGTKKWYERTFGVEAVRGKARMIPFVF